MKPVVDGLKPEYEDSVEFRLYNVETDPEGVEVANAMGITAVPTFVFIGKDGVSRGTRIGAIPEQELRGLLDELK